MNKCIFIKKIMKKLLIVILSLFFLQGSEAQTLPSQKIAKESCLAVVPDAIFVESEREVPPELLPKKKKVYEIGWSEPCPNGGAGGIIGTYTCYRNSFLDIQWGHEWCVVKTVANTCQ